MLISHPGIVIYSNPSALGTIFSFLLMLSYLQSHPPWDLCCLLHIEFLMYQSISTRSFLSPLEVSISLMIHQAEREEVNGTDSKNHNNSPNEGSPLECGVAAVDYTEV